MVGTLALIGFPPFSGFFSKDAILALAYEHNPPFSALALFTAFLTAFYMMRLVVVVFFGKPRSDRARGEREAPLVMIVPADRPRDSGVRRRLRIFRAAVSSRCPRTGSRLRSSRCSRSARCLLGVALGVFLYRKRESDPIDRRRFCDTDFTSTNFTRWLINATQGFLARVSPPSSIAGFIDAGAVRGASGATWGFGSLLRCFRSATCRPTRFSSVSASSGLIYFTVFR